MIDFLTDGPPDSTTTLILAHGAGAPMDSEWMNTIAAGVGATGVHVLRFEFPYMAERRTSGKRRPPDRQPTLLATWREAFAAADASRTLIGGKSMGGRIASMVADELGAAGLVCLGYPFHAPGRPEVPRIAHLEHLATPTLIIQGTADTFGREEEVRTYPLSPSITIEWLEGGNHDLVARGLGKAASRTRVIERVGAFIENR